jgi:hypothetical protein
MLDRGWFVSGERLYWAKCDGDFTLDTAESGQYYDEKLWPKGVHETDGFTVIQTGSIETTHEHDTRRLWVFANHRKCQDVLIRRIVAG